MVNGEGQQAFLNPSFQRHPNAFHLDLILKCLRVFVYTIPSGSLIQVAHTLYEEGEEHPSFN